MKRKYGISLMVVGVICILSAAAILVYNNYENVNAQKQSSDIVDSLISVANQTQPHSYEDDPFDTEMKTTKIDGYDYIGYLYIPDLDLDLPVMSQWDYKRLKISPCRYYGSVKTNNLVIAAHNYKSHFGYLGKLEPGSTIIFTDVDSKKYRYEVASIEILQPYDVDKVKDAQGDLILYTCTYGGAARVTVRCNILKELP